MNFSMFNDSMLKWVIAIIIFGFIGWSTYKTIKLIQANRKALELFKSQHPHAELLDGSRNSMLLTFAFGIICLVFLFITGSVLKVDMSQIFYYRVAYIALALMFFGQGVEMSLLKKLWFAEDGFFYLEKFYRFRMITSYERQKGTVPTVKIQIGQEGIVLPNNMAVAVKEHAEAWKAEKKASKKKGKI